MPNELPIPQDHSHLHPEFRKAVIAELRGIAVEVSQDMTDDVPKAQLSRMTYLVGYINAYADTMERELNEQI